MLRRIGKLRFTPTGWYRQREFLPFSKSSARRLSLPLLELLPGAHSLWIEYGHLGQCRHNRHDRQIETLLGYTP